MTKLGAIKELVWQGDFRKLWGVGIVTGSMRWLEVLGPLVGGVVYATLGCRLQRESLFKHEK